MTADLAALLPYLRAIEHHVARCAEALETLARLADERATADRSTELEMTRRR